ncbi:MAG: tyrosine-type recombinase/integrase [Tepidisphaerales bacterium]
MASVQLRRGVRMYQPAPGRAWMGSVAWRGGVLRFALLRSKAASQGLLLNVAHVAELAAAGLALDDRATRTVAALPDALRARLVAAGVVPGVYAAAVEPLQQHVDRFLAALRDRRRVPEYVAAVELRLRNLLGGLATWRDATPAVLADRLADLSARRGWSAATRNAHVTAVRSLARWCVRAGLLAADPTTGLDRADNAGARERRALSLDEARWLLDYLRDQPGPGGERALTYELAIQTGLRRGELASLTVADFDLAGEPAVVRLPGARTKNGRDALLPIPAETAARLREAFARKLPGAKALRVGDASKAAKQFRRDVGAAREAWVAAGGDAGSDFLRDVDGAGRVLVFHSLRHTRGAWLFAHHKVTPREAMDAMRLQSLALVERYSRSMRLDVDRLAKTAPSLALPEAAVAAAESGARSGARLGVCSYTKRDFSGRSGRAAAGGSKVANRSVNPVDSDVLGK